MSMWNRIIALPEDQQRQLFSIYNQNIPIEIRMQLAEWIERQNWSLGEDDSEQTNLLKSQLIQQFGLEIKNLIEMSNDVAYRYKLSNYLNMITNQSSDMNAIIKNIHDCLQYEKEFILCHQEEMPFPQINNFFSNFRKSSQVLEIIKENLVQAENMFKNIKTIKETFNINQLELSCYDIQTTSNDNAAITMKKKLLETMNCLHAQYQTYFNELIIKYRDIIAKIQEISIILFDEVNIWKQQQKNNLISQKTDSPENLAQLKHLSESMATNICNLWQQLKFIDALVSNDSNEDVIILSRFIEIKKQVMQLFKNLVSETFIVKKQPKQVIKKETKFDAHVILLAGSVLNVQMNSLVVRVQIINEEQAKLWYTDKDKFLLNSCCGEIVNNTTVMEYNSATNTLSANFINLRLKSIKRAEKKASIDKVVDEKFALMFTTEIYLKNDVKFVISTISVPVVVIVHGNQKIHALSTIIWDNSFSELKRCPFNVPAEVKLGDLCQVLSRLFYDFSQRHLSEDNIHFLAEKIIGHEIDKQHYYNILVPWTKFSKDLLPELEFSFWDWFYNILQLTREHLKEIWAEGHLIGFITRQRAEMLLMNKPPGTFLLRYSETNLGGISVAYRTSKVECLNPFDSKGLKTRKMADCLKDIGQFIYLYPDIPKDTAFGHLYTKIENQSSNGYVFTQLKNCIPSENDQESNYSNLMDHRSIMMNDAATTSSSFSDLTTSITNMSYETSYDWNRNPIDRDQSSNEYNNYFSITNDTM